ncbi:MAG: hypothetical protein ACAI44_09950 [Candidatus Sericytochromatia bacterium]
MTQPKDFTPDQIADFTEVGYQRLLALALKAYRIVDYPELLQASSGLVWRHDVDFSPQRALKLAGFEQALGIRACYFFLLSSPHYNLLEAESRRILARILELGHEVGLHFDATVHAVADHRQLEAALAFERQLLEALSGKPVPVFSFHNPGAFELSCDALRYAGMYNTYARPFQTDIGYCSDSNGYWRYHRLEDVLRQAAHPRLQVLTHPEWWQAEPMYPRARIERCLQGRSAAQLASYDRLLMANNRVNAARPSHREPSLKEGTID